VLRREVGALAALVLACAFFSTQHPRFLTPDNFALVLQQVMVVGTIAVGQTLVILTAGVDLSCGMVMALGGMVLTTAAASWGLDAPLALATGAAVTTTAGVVNGLLVTRLGLPPFIVTLGTMNIAFALTQLMSDAQTVTELPASILAPGETVTVAGAEVMVGVAMWIILTLAAWFILTHTATGRHVYATGNNAEGSRLAGINTTRVILGVYVVAGACYGLASWLGVARTGVGDPNAGQTENLDAITAVVLGGASLFGGRGSVLGTLVGVLIVGVFRNGLTLMGVSSVYQVLVTGVLVILAVSTDQVTRRARR